MLATSAIRLGFPVRVVGRPGLRAPSSRAASHLSISLVQLQDLLAYLEHIAVRFYRVAPLPAGQAAAQIGECRNELAALAAQLAARNVRLTVHLDYGAALAGNDPRRAAAVLEQIEAQAALLEALDRHRPGQLAEGIMVTHLGASPADPLAEQRFIERYLALSPCARSRLALEHDDAGFSLGRLLALHQHCGIPVVFDTLHWSLHNPERLPLDLALGLAIATWPPTIRPEVHLSSARSEAHLLPGRAGQTPRIVPPYHGQHADFVVAADLQRLLIAARGLPPFDLMIEAKAGDLALLRLRNEISRLDPQLAARLN